LPAISNGCVMTTVVGRCYAGDDGASELIGVAGTSLVNHGLKVCCEASGRTGVAVVSTM
jgi:hypothetical protein